MLYVILILSFISGVTFVYGVFYLLAADRLYLEKRLEQIKGNTMPESIINQDLQRSFMDRVVRPLLRSISSITTKFTPAKKKINLEKKLTLAGNPMNLNPNEFISLYYTLVLFFGLTGFIFALTSNLNFLSQIMSFGIGMLLGYIIVELYLKIKTQIRQESISKSLPDVLDLLTVSVEAGLGFDAALQRVVQKIKGPISLEFATTLQEIKMGKQRKDALKDLGHRTGVQELNTIISAIIQAEQLGISIGNVLRLQSNQLRNIRRQRTEEKAMKAPIKMLVPMVLFIFPTIFIVTLAPAIIQVIENLSQ
ncbi:MAG: tight adherence protein [Clostridia bacterium]|nr:tight adherence protein [Clostridia bacterium]